MVPSEVISGGFGIVGVLIGSGLQYWNSRKSAEEASRRLREEKKLDSKFERLERLHDSLDDCLRQFREVTVQGPADVEDYSNRVREPYDEFRDAINKSRIYLSPEEKEAIDETREKFNNHRTYLRTWAEAIDDDWHDSPVADDYELTRDELDEAAQPVFDIVRRKLDPEFDDSDN